MRVKNYISQPDHTFAIFIKLTKGKPTWPLSEIILSTIPFLIRMKEEEKRKTRKRKTQVGIKIHSEAMISMYCLYIKKLVSQGTSGSHP
jgi:hypothetical protein